jgi:hypothetical protein
VVGNPRAASLASAIVEMGHALGKVVIAEGVETVEQATLLQGIGCDVGQGFYFSKPISPSAFAELLRESPRFVPARADSLADTKVPAPQCIEREGTASLVFAGGSVLPAGLLGQAAIGRGPA